MSWVSKKTPADMRCCACSWTQTDLGNDGAKSFGMAEAPIPLKTSVEFLVATVS